MKEVVIKNWQDFENLIKETNDEDFIFRGVSNANYKLIPSLYREILQISDKDERINEMEKVFFREDDVFKLIIRYECPEGQLSLSELCKLQHYSVPTRLLDFTKNIEIALAFALIDFYSECRIENDEDAAIYILKKSDFEPEYENDDELLAELIYKYNEEDCSAIELSDGAKAKYPLSATFYECPDDSIERIVKQEGCFLLFPHAFEDDHMEIKEEQIQIKAVIKSGAKTDLINHLKYKMADLK